MGKRQQVDQISPRRRRLGSIAVAGALPLVTALAVAGTASADPVPGEDSAPAAVAPVDPADPNVTVDSPFGEVAVPPELAEGMRGLLGPAPAAAEAEATDSAAVAEGVEPAAEGVEAAAEGVEPAVAAAPVLVDRNSATGVRAIPNGPLAAVDVQQLRAPDPMAAPDVAPIAAPDGMLRFGDTVLVIPEWMNAEQAATVNSLVGEAEADLARTLDSAGFEPSRSDRIAAQTVGTAAVGAGVGVAVAAPLEVAGAVMGGFIGAMAGTPFAPAGWVFGPAVGATAAVALIAVPAATIGAGIGAAVGAVNGYMAPATEGAPVADEAGTEAAAVTDEVAVEE
ncbi:hypothetical protein [Nocardia huaxiensis]|uniref:Uncharacterized protein n=1 Tax=Nocardia huaxiensis TaxID=2755382 RepID=A0A7D6YYW8_9NOCA|nr:hypothetical protein [Nocardia huaxiensis]QLY27786.1 hypothetical protein H0264_20235 [Nocardia huaxiensis]UFS98820.1 hypothetical protein LPY97_13460 [Nocardia huaxiensis]